MLHDGAEWCDAIITSGGVSMGDRDVVKLVLGPLTRGDTQWMQVAIRPAKPFAFGVLSDAGIPVFGLPGNPVSAMVSFELLARPALRRMAGHEVIDRPVVTAVTDGVLSRRRDGKIHFPRVVARWEHDGVMRVTPMAGQQSHQISAGEFARVLEAISGHSRPDGSLYSASFRNVLLYRFREATDIGRAGGLMAEVPDAFSSARRRRVVSDPNEDEIGKALPEAVTCQLDRHLGILGPTGRMGPIATDDLQAMQRAIYKIRRDTGRRPGDVVSLKLGYVEVIDGHHNLIFDNHKAGRWRQRLPITTGTAEVIGSWERRRKELPPAGAKWLFPSPLLRAARSVGHLTAAGVGAEFRAWVRKIPTIDGEVLDNDGRPAPFDRRRITPYALRHSYAQRHADAGVPVDVLRALLDHVSVQTTMGYYSVSLKCKRQAIATVGSLAFPARANAAPFTDPVAYERASVSVPLGSSTEPANVRAGGGHCPIRFQCAGCSFYRPDPSYLPALEEHLASLRADRESALAMDAAAYVLSNLSADQLRRDGERGGRVALARPRGRVRDQVEAARARQGEPGRPPVPVSAGKLPASAESLQTELAVAREEIRPLRAELVALKKATAPAARCGDRGPREGATDHPGRRARSVQPSARRRARRPSPRSRLRKAPDRRAGRSA